VREAFFGAGNYHSTVLDYDRKFCIESQASHEWLIARKEWFYVRLSGIC